MSHEHENLIISLMEARKKGKTIQYYDCYDGWLDIEQADYNFPDGVKYRIKPDEPREFLLAKAKISSGRSAGSYWVVSSGKEYDASVIACDYIRVREILED
jgi:hypothetical protein